MKLVQNTMMFWPYVYTMRFHPLNIDGFVEKDKPTYDQHCEYMKKHGLDYYICVDDRKILGYVAVVDNDIKICTHPDHKQKGVGKFMLNEIMKTHPRALAKIYKSNAASLALFKSCGFVQVGEDNVMYYFRK